MINKNFNLEKIAGDFVVANTPRFLLRKLQEDFVVKAIASDCTEDEIIGALKNALITPLKSLDDEVLRYVYLVALSKSPDISFLRKAAKLIGKNQGWLSYISLLLLEQYRPATVIKQPLPQTPVKPTTTIGNRNTALVSKKKRTMTPSLPPLVAPPSLRVRSYSKVKKKVLSVSKYGHAVYKSVKVPPLRAVSALRSAEPALLSKSRKDKNS